MNAWYMLMDPKFGLYTSPLVSGRTGGALGNMAGKQVYGPGKQTWRAKLANFFARRALAMELVRLDNRMLDDIGLVRDQIPTVLDGMESGWTSRRSLKSELDRLAA